MSDKKRLSLEQQLKLGTYLGGRKDELIDKRPAYENVAAQATKAVGFTVTQAHVRTVVAALGFCWKARRRIATNRAGTDERLSKRIRILAMALRDLQKSLGNPVDTRIDRIALGMPLDPEPEDGAEDAGIFAANGKAEAS